MGDPGRASMHNNCNARPRVLSFSLLPSLPLHTCASVYASAPLLLAFVRECRPIAGPELRQCLPVGKYYSNRRPPGVTIMFSFATNPTPTAPFRLTPRVSPRERAKGPSEERRDAQRERAESLRSKILSRGQGARR